MENINFCSKTDIKHYKLNIKKTNEKYFEKF